MKRLAILLLLLAGAPTANAGELSGGDKKRLAAYYTLHVIDWGQTLHLAEKIRDCEPFVNCAKAESNPILGPEPTKSEVNRYFIATGLLYLGTVYLLPPAARKWFQYGAITVQLGFVANNYRAGIRVDF